MVWSVSICKRGLLIGALGLCLTGLQGKNCQLVRIGALPLPDLGSGLYQGLPGGLYPGGQSTLPASHRDAGLNLAASLQPLTSQGTPDPSGFIVLISIGMSNAAQEFSAGSNSFITRLAGSTSLSPHLRIINCAEPGMTVEHWLDPSGQVYSNCYSRLNAEGLSSRQVQAAWIKQAEPGGGCCAGSFPDHALYQKDRLAQMVRVVKQNFPNLGIAHLSSRTRAYEDHPAALNPEPIAYETNFSVKWLIEDQINGSAGLNFDPARGPVVAPWLAWGPYLWADGLEPRSDGLVWECDDTAPDGIHPSQSGVRKVSDQLLAFYHSDPTATPWFLKSGRDFTVEIQSQTVSSDPPVVSFSAVASGSAPVEYFWTFGDGLTSLSANPVKGFPFGGDYPVVVTARDGNGNLASDEILLRLGEPSTDRPEPPLNLRIIEVRSE